MYSYMLSDGVICEFEDGIGTATVAFGGSALRFTPERLAADSCNVALVTAAVQYSFERSLKAQPSEMVTTEMAADGHATIPWSATC
jgi:hypothetical protein